MKIPWSEESERRLRRWIFFLRCSWMLLAVLGLCFLVEGILVRPHSNIGVGMVLFTASAFLLSWAISAIQKLGWEEYVSRGVRIPGSGMLANKPRDTSRLTKWIRHERGEAPLGFTCHCWRPYNWENMKWTANVVECEEEMGDAPAVAVDPEGGRSVLICECGIGHYMLDKIESRAAAQEPGAVEKAKSAAADSTSPRRK